MRIYSDEIISKMNYLYRCSDIKENIGFYIYGVKKDNDIIFNKCSEITFHNDNMIFNLIYNIDNIDVVNYIYLNNDYWKDQVYYDYLKKHYNIEFQNININDIIDIEHNKKR